MATRLCFVVCILLACVWGTTHRLLASSAKPLGVHALVNARLIISPGHTIENGTLIVRDGRIEAVGLHIRVPMEARVHDMEGRTVHAGFIDPYVNISRVLGKPYRPRKPFLSHEEPDPATEEAKPKPQESPKTSAASSANPRVHPDLRVVDGLTPKLEALEALRGQGFVLLQVVPDSGIFRGTAALCLAAPGSPRDTVLAADSAAVITLEPRDGYESERDYPASIMGNMAQIRQTFADAAWYEQAWKIEGERHLGTKRPETDLALAALSPLLHDQMPVIFESSTLLEDLRGQALLDELGVRRRMVVLSGEEWRRMAWAKRLWSATNTQGLILPLAFTVTPRAKSEGEWLDVSLLELQRWRNDPANPRWLDEAHCPFALTTHRQQSTADFRKAIRRAIEAGLSADTALAALTTRPAKMLGISDRFGTLEVGKSASLVVVDGQPFDKDTRVREVWIEGVRYQNDEEPAKKVAATVKPPPFSADDYRNGPGEDFDVSAINTQTVLVKNATIWTVGSQGTVEHGDLLVSGGVIKAVGHNLGAPPHAVLIDGSGLHVTPGIIDCHSHTAIDGDVNESTHSVTAEVRIKDVLDPFSIAMLRELAGGVTSANVLHGSANTIGGQVVTCKWRFGEAPELLLMRGAPEGIKFALGENPKQSHWGDRKHPRYPQTRLGVAELIRERFVAARDYRKAWTEFRAGARPLPPRKDYQLETLLEIIDGKRYVHCHSYRQDEILTLIRLAEELGFSVKTFQHVLEGYKVSDEIARHGAGASTFSDWWAYKHEVMDAIPYNGALMHDRGVVTSFNSDSDELARRLNTEAAKAVRYGNLSTEEALAFVTINPARQLGVDNRVGSLEPGKDGDFVVWTANPLSQGAICLQTWIEGRKYFDRAEDLANSKRRAAEHEALAALARKAPSPARDVKEEEERP